MTDATLVWDERALLGEAPLWDEREQCLHWVDVDAYTLHTLWPASGERSSTTHDARISSVGLRETCSFGGRDLDTLQVTSARTGLGPAALARKPHAGSLFSIDAGVRGRPAFRFAG
jgi:sugar lactone lactonase YvrE